MTAEAVILKSSHVTNNISFMCATEILVVLKLVCYFYLALL